MNMLKRTLAMMLVLCMLFTMAPITAFAEDTTDPAGTATPAADGDLGDNTLNGEVLKTVEPPKTDESMDDVTKDDVTKDDVTKDDVTKDDVTKDDVTKDDVTKDDETKDDVTKDDVTKDDVTKDDVTKDDVTKDDETKDDVTEDDVTKDDVTKDDETKDDVTKDDEDAEVTDPTEDPYGIATVAEDPYGVATAAVEPVTGTLTYASDYRILHLDCGRKYFTKDWIIALINEMEDAGYTHLELAVGNDNLRFLLDDMTVGSYTDAQVTDAIQVGNAAKHGAGELTQSEMDAIIAHAKNKGIGIIPLLNTPGHMYAIVTAMQNLGMSNPQFGYSASTVDVTNTEAVTFTQDLVKKYVDYFASQGCNEFNLGADEFANDDGNGQFSTLVNNGTYGNFIDYLNTLANYVVSKGMVPMAFNDGIYYNETTDQGTIHPQIMVSYWSSGWWAYDLAPADYLANEKGFKMINVNGAYYYILGKDDKWTPGETTTHDPALYTEASSWTNSGFPSSHVSNPMGGMFCIWCDYPNFETETDIAANARMILRAMAAEMKGEDGTAVSDEVIPGGFNKDGTIAEDCNNVTVKDDASSVEVTGCDLTSVTVTEAEAPTIADTAAVLAWDITPYVDGKKYEGSATVKLPVPADWNTKLVKGFYMEKGAAVTVEGTYADDFYTFKMPHFSVGGLMLLDASTQYDQPINLEVGGTHQIEIKNVNYDGEYATNPTGIATVVAEYKAGEGTSETPATSVNEGESYYLKNDEGQYMKADATFTTDIAEATKWTLVASTNGYMIHNENNQYLFYEDGWILFDGWGDDFKFMNGKLVDYYVATQSLIPVSGGGSVDQSTITFTGIAPGTTYATVGDTTYKIVVTEQVEITIKYQTANGTVIKTETVTVADNATTYTVSNFNHNGKYYTVADTALTIDPKNITTYPVTVTETTENLDEVEALVIEFMQTNSHVTDTSGATSKQVSAEDAYSESGLSLLDLIPQNGANGSSSVNYWRSRLLRRPDQVQGDYSGADDRTWTGVGFTKVRYWNGTWAVYADATETEPAHWEAIEEPSAYQLVAYYMNNMNLADEVNIGTSDWGKKGDGTMKDQYLGGDHVSIAFQVIYEDNTKAPINETAEQLDSYTYLVDNWGTRGVGTIAINQIGAYQIWKVTAETGTHTTEYNGAEGYSAYVTGFTWDNNEMTVWENKNNPVSQYTIKNVGDDLSTEGAYANLVWNEVNESILIRIYVKTVETEDSLKVVYYDEKFGAVLEEFNISVPTGNNFNDNIVLANTETIADPPVFKYIDENENEVEVPDRVNADGYGIVNTVPKIQNFETNLANVAITNNRYSAELYKYTGSVISTDGKTITHYYNINQKALSPNFVVDFGLPLTFKLSDVVQEGLATVMDVTVNPKTLYGTLSYTEDTRTVDGTFTYTPTQILPTIDVLTISITFDDDEEEGPKTVTTNVGVTPATTVYYEESFLTYGTGWTGGTTMPTKHQNTAVLGEDSNNYGYDAIYAADASGSHGTKAATSTNGATASFTFTGTGFALYANCNEGTGYVTLTREGQTKKMYMMDTGLNYNEKVQMPGATATPSGWFYNIPIITEKNLPHGTYTVTIRKTNNDKENLEIDGFRVYETVDESEKDSQESFYYNDKEDNPVFYELRDVVLKSIGASGANSSQVYKDLGNGVYSTSESVVGLITDPRVTYADNAILDDLLNNGPKNEIYLFTNQTLSFKITTDRLVQIGLKAPNGTTKYTINDGEEQTMNSSVDMFYTVLGKATEAGRDEQLISVKNTGDKILAITDLKVCDDPGFSFAPLNEADIAAILEETTEPEAPTYTMVELKGTDVLIDGTVFDYTGEAIEPAITVNVNGTQLVEGRDYSVTYTNNVQPGTATVTVRGIATASETLGYTGEVSIDYTINAPAEPEVPEETTKPTKPGKPEKPDNGNKPGENRPGNGNNKPGKPSADKNEKQKDAKLKITFVNLMGKKVASATLTKTGTANQNCVFSADEITANAPARRYAVWFFPVIIPYGSTSSIVVPVF